MNNKKTILVSGSASNAGSILLDTVVKAGYNAKILVDSIGSADYLGIKFPILNTRGTWDKENIKKFIRGCDAVIHLAPIFTEAICEVHPGTGKIMNSQGFVPLLEVSKACGVKRFIYVLVPGVHEIGKSADITQDLVVESLTDCPSPKIPSEDYLRKAASENFSIITIRPTNSLNYSPLHKLDLAVRTFTGNSARNCKINLFGGKNVKDRAFEGFPAAWYGKGGSYVPTCHLKSMADLCLSLLEHSTEKIGKKTWSHIVTYQIYLKRFFVTRKLLQYLADPKILIYNIKFVVRIIKRLFDVTMMMFLLHVWPEQTYRFSTRKVIPNRRLCFPRSIDRTVPLELIESRTSVIHRMEEVNIIMRGASFDIHQLENIDGPIYLVRFLAPIETDKDVVYATNDLRQVQKLLEAGVKVLHVEGSAVNEHGEIFNHDGDSQSEWYERLLEHPNCKRISIVEKIFRPRKQTLGVGAPVGTGIAIINALYPFAEKINVYGWDFYLESSPDDMSYWELFFYMYIYKLDIKRSRNYFESAMLNFYYGYHLSKLPNVNIYGRMGQLGKHEKLIKKIERSLFI